MYVKYPKTMHLPWSPGLQNDDRVLQGLDAFKGEEVVVTEKMDGENTTMYRDHIHARSLDGRHHSSRDWVKAFHGQIKYMFPDLEGLRICGENVYAEHSITYDNLPSYFLGFGVWVGDRCLNWDTTLKVFDSLGITPVPTLFRGSWEHFKVWRHNLLDNWDTGQFEGYVVRVARGFDAHEFQKVVAKYVRKNHVQTDQHWMAKPVIPNGLAR
jgi:hypothetical protein